jgi:orotidine-5'-phosphate decarboxylase
MMAAEKLIVAIDTTDAARAASIAQAVAPHCGLFKLGLEFFTANGPAGVRAIGGRPVFLDLKLHDIPNTVAGAVRAVLPLGPRMLTLHAAGGAAMIAAAREAAETAGPQRPMLLAVTVLTSLDAAALAATGVADAPAHQAVRLGRLAIAAGADGLVCSAHEIAGLRDALGAGVKLVVPGIRPAGSRAGDQARTMTPRAALDAGADWIVVGRPITEAADPAAAAAGLFG